MMLECKKCGEERSEIYFTTALVKGKRYYRRNACKLCLGLNEKKIYLSYNKPIKSNKLSPEDRSFIKSIENGRIDMLVAYRLAHIFLNYFDDIREDLPVEIELMMMLEKLRGLE